MALPGLPDVGSYPIVNPGILRDESLFCSGCDAHFCDAGELDIHVGDAVDDPSRGDHWYGSGVPVPAAMVEYRDSTLANQSRRARIIDGLAKVLGETPNDVRDALDNL
jgi:hypothetical protein